MTEQKPLLRICLFNGPILIFGRHWVTLAKTRKIAPGAFVGTDSDESRLVTYFKTQKTAYLLAYLALCRSHAETRDNLIHLLWPARQPDHAEDLGPDPHFGRNSLRAALTAIRHHLDELGILPDTVLITDRTEVRLNPNVFTTDVADFDRLIGAARRQSDPIRRVSLFQQAVALYRGELLPEYYKEWAVAEKLRLQDCYLTSVEQLVRSLLRAGEPEQAMATLRSAAGLYPFEEDLVALIEEMDPIAPTHVAAMPRRLASCNRTPQRSVCVPVRLARFFGRSEEIARLVDWCADPHTRLITITGLGGIGKTRLSIEVARRMAGYPLHRIAFIELAQLSSPDRMHDAIAAALQLPPSPGVAPIDQVVAALADRPTLLILDNLEHLLHWEIPPRKAGPRPIDAADIVTSLLLQLPKLTCLCTSRSPLKIDGEQIFPLDPLPVPVAATPAVDRKEPESAEPCDSVRLFLDRARKFRPDLRLTREHEKAVAEICRRLDGIPLAIELTASWARTLSPGEMLERLDRSTREFTTQHRDAPNRHYSMEEVLNWSYNLLTEPQRRLMRRLSVFSGGWTLDAAEQICEEPDALRHIGALQTASLISAVDQDGETTRYRFLEPVRVDALRRLRESGEESWLCGRHLAYFLRLAEEVGESRGVEPPIDWLDRVEADYENCRVALERALSAHEEDEKIKDEGGSSSSSLISYPPSFALRLAASLGRYCVSRGRYRDGRPFLEVALERDTEAAGTLRAWSLYVAAQLALLQDDRETANARITCSIDLFRAEQNMLGAAYALRYHGIVLMHYDQVQPGWWPEAVTRYEESLSLFRLLGDRAGIALVLQNLAFSMWYREPIAKVMSWFQESLETFEELGNRRGTAGVLNALGHLHLYGGKIERARELYSAAMKLYRQIGAPLGIAEALCHLGLADRNASRFEEAAAELEAALIIFQDLGHNRQIARMLCYLAEIACYRGRLEQATTLVEQALKVCDKIGIPHVYSTPLRLQATLARFQRDYVSARRLIEESLALIEDSWPPHFHIAPALIERALIACGQRDEATAQTSLEKVIDILDTMKCLHRTQM